MEKEEIDDLLAKAAKGGPHEWGYRDPVTGDFIHDDWPYRAAEALQATRLRPAASDLVEVCQRILDRGYISSSIEEERGDHDDLVAALSAHQGEGEPVAWVFEAAGYYNKSSGEWSGWEQRISEREPSMGGGMRNVRPLYAHPPTAPHALLSISDQTWRDGVLIEVERNSDGKVLICNGCGTVETVRSIKRRIKTAFTCCPERKMLLAVTERSDREGVHELLLDATEDFPSMADSAVALYRKKRVEEALALLATPDQPDQFAQEQ